MTGKGMSSKGTIASAVILIAVLIAGCDGAQDREAAYLERGKVLFKQGDFVKARLEFKNARQINPAGVEALFYTGRISEKLGELRPAFAIYLMVLQRDSKHVGAHLKLGEFFLLAGDLDHGP